MNRGLKFLKYCGNNASIENAKTFLDDYYMDIIYSVFTDEVIEQYRLEHENELLSNTTREIISLV